MIPAGGEYVHFGPNRNVTDAPCNRRQDPPSTQEDHRVTGRPFEDYCEEAEALFAHRSQIVVSQWTTYREIREFLRYSSHHRALKLSIRCPRFLSPCGIVTS